MRELRRDHWGQATGPCCNCLAVVSGSDPSFIKEAYDAFNYTFDAWHSHPHRHFDRAFRPLMTDCASAGTRREGRDCGQQSRSTTRWQSCILRGRAGAEQATMWPQLRPPGRYCYPPEDQKLIPAERIMMLLIILIVLLLFGGGGGYYIGGPAWGGGIGGLLLIVLIVVLLTGRR